jgi:polyphosphate kinase
MRLFQRLGRALRGRALRGRPVVQNPPEDDHSPGAHFAALAASSAVAEGGPGGPEASGLREAPGLPKTPGLPAASGLPETPGLAETPGLPEALDLPETPCSPEAPAVAGAPWPSNPAGVGVSDDEDELPRPPLSTEPFPPELFAIPPETAPGPGEAGPEAAQRYINRELSALDFNRRVLTLAGSKSQPLLERARYLAIFTSNMDEFFQVRVAGLKDQLAAGLAGITKDGLSVSAQLAAIHAQVTELMIRRERILLDEIVPELAEAGIRLSPVDTLNAEDQLWLKQVFAERIFPVLTPLAVDPGHPFPYISNLSLNLAVIVRDPARGDRRFARLKVPPLLPGFLRMPDRERFVPLEEVIAAHLGSLFPGMAIESHHVFRVTRNADLTLQEEEADDLLLAVEMELRRRRFGRAVRLEVDKAMTDELRTLLARELELTAADVYEVDGPLELSGLWSAYGLDRPELKDPPFVPVTPASFVSAEEEPLDVFEAIRGGDILLHHPYDSFSCTVEQFVDAAAGDPDVLAIKQTLYRTSGDSPIIRSLIRAAEAGKQVAALVELKARGDEAANIGWARQLEQAGVHVVYGLVGLKTHSKTLLVVRQEGDGIRRYCHIGTGNYNSATAQLYEDLGLLTASPALGSDLTDLFNYLTGYSRRVEYRELLVAPAALRPRMLELIKAETALGERGRIVWKLNNLVDQEVIDALYEASAAGVQIDLITRAICCLRPGVPGLSENIRVRSLVGRWLEHSRIYYFGAGTVPAEGAAVGGVEVGGAEKPTTEALPGFGPIPLTLPDGGEVLIGSADMMERNLDRRVEAVVPVTEPALAARLKEMLEVCLADDQLAWALSGDGTWQRVAPHGGVDAHRWFQERAELRKRLDAPEPSPPAAEPRPAAGSPGHTANGSGPSSQAPAGTERRP